MGSITRLPGAGNSPVETPEDINDLSPAPAVVDFDECPPALNTEGRADWAHVIALQAHIQVAQLKREIELLKTCPVCGGNTCRTVMFCDTVIADEERRANVKAILESVRERGPSALREPANIERLRRCGRADRARIDAYLKRF
jgi:hypothetical protein